MTTAAYNAERDKFNRSVQWCVELTLDRCTLTYGTATDGCGVDADLGDNSRCYYSYTTCQNVTGYTRGTRSLKFCLAAPPWPDDAVPAFPLLRKIVTVPQRIDPAKLFTYPGSVSAHFNLDYTPLPMDRDKTVYNSGTTGEFWRNLLARNRNYVGRPMKIYRGFYAPGFAWSDFEQVGPTLKIKQIQVDRGECVITGESALANLEGKQIPWAISDDNTLQTAVGNSVLTDWTIKDGSEYPNPADFTRNASSVFVLCESEICRLVSIDATAGTMVVERGQWGTTATSHALGKKVSHVLCVGHNNGTDAPGPDNCIEVIQDLFEWAGIAASDVSTTSFDLVKEGAWPEDDTYYYRTKPEKISKLLQGLRESRGLCLYVDPDGKYSCTVMAPLQATPAATITQESIVMDSSAVEEDDEYRITRCSFYYDPTTDKDTSGDIADYDRAVVVVDTDLEAANLFGEKKDKQFLDAWIYPTAETSTIRNVARRLITRLRFGVRTFTFDVELKNDVLNVGDEITLTTPVVLDSSGAQSARPCLIISREEMAESVTRYEALDLYYARNYFRVGPTTMATNWSDATTSDKTFGYWGDANNRLGAENSEGFIYW